jgi:hypothetical protein
MGSHDCHEPVLRTPRHTGVPSLTSSDPLVPATLVTALVLTAVVGVVNVLVASRVFALLAFGTLRHDPDVPVHLVLTVALAHLVLGCVTVPAAVRMSGLRHSSRVVLTVVMSAGMALASLSAGLIGTWCSTGSLIAIPLSWVAIALLWDSRANEYFHAAR